jgi:hypothetical protein
MSNYSYQVEETDNLNSELTEETENDTMSSVSEETKVETNHVVNTYSEPKKEAKPMSNEIKVSLTIKDRVEIVNKQTGQRSTMVPSNGSIKLNNTNVYCIPITNKEFNLDEMNAVKTLNVHSEYFQVLSVANGIVKIKSIVNGFTLKNKTVVGSII